MKLEITVQDDINIRAKLDDRSEVSGRVEDDLLLMTTIQFLRTLLESGRLNEIEGLKILGSHLYRLIFVDPINAAFESALREARESRTKNDEKLRLRFTFQRNAVKLATLPWEFLYRPDEETIKGYFLAAETKLTLFRYMPRGGGSDFEKLREPLKVLVAFAEPPELPGGTSVITNKDAIKKELGNCFKRLGVKSDFLDDAKLETLKKRIDSYKPHVLHFIGHGLMGRRDINGVVSDNRIGLLNEENNLYFYRDSLFVNNLTSAENNNLRLVVLQLNDCDHRAERAQYADYSSSFAGIARPLIESGISAVVAMQFPVSFKLAMKFNESFYARLAEGNDIDLAVQQGRKMIYDDSNYFETPVFGTPILYVVREDGIVEPGQTKPEEPERREGLSAGTPLPVPDQTKAGEPVKKQVKDAGYLRNRGQEKSQELGLSAEQRASLGKIYSKLFAEKTTGSGNYRQVLEQAMTEFTDLQIQDVIFAMLGELED